MLNHQEETQSLFRWMCRGWAVKIRCSKETVHGLELTVTWREIVENKLNTRKYFTKWRGTKTNKKHKPVKLTQSGRTRVCITLTTGLTQTGRATRAQICGLILHGSKRQDSCHRRSPLKNSPTQHVEKQFPC